MVITATYFGVLHFFIKYIAAMVPMTVIAQMVLNTAIPVDVVIHFSLGTSVVVVVKLAVNADTLEILNWSQMGPKINIFLHLFLKNFFTICLNKGN